MTQPRVKVCCISSVEEAKLAIENGASALGLVGNMPKEAIATVQPFGVDVCSSVRTNGKLDEEKLQQFFEEVRSRSC